MNVANGLVAGDTMLAGIADILPPAAPYSEAGSALWLMGWVVAFIIALAMVLIWWMAPAQRLLRLAQNCESGRLDPREAAHRLAAEVVDFSGGERLNDNCPLPRVPSCEWQTFVTSLASQRFSAERPTAAAVGHTVRQARDWLRRSSRAKGEEHDG